MKNYKWIIKENAIICEKSIDGLSNVIVTIQAIRQIYTDNNFKEIFLHLGLNKPTGQFIPYENITQEIIEKWLNENLPINEIDESLSIELDNIINPTTIVLPNPF